MMAEKLGFFNVNRDDYRCEGNSGKFDIDTATKNLPQFLIRFLP